MESGFWSIITAEVRYDKRLKPNAKLLYSEISALTKQDGYCWAKNEHFAELYGVGVQTVSRWISQLKDYGYLDVEIDNKSGGFVRKIRLVISSNAPCHFEQTAMSKKANRHVKKSNIIINTNNKKEEESALEFLENESPSLYENFLLKFKSKIQDFQKFCELFNCKVDEEGLEYVSKKINARLTRFAINYIENENKGFAKQNNQFNQVNAPTQQQYQKNTF